ncbi:MAG: hypothetical protein HBSAPP03_05970 [Phycisphaerae bacterium]|nr:MAG: hypothetical protein HBSAPP03_05970 [Phycisphaerae bacterium]
MPSLTSNPEVLRIIALHIRPNGSLRVWHAHADCATRGQHAVALREDVQSLNWIGNVLQNMLKAYAEHASVGDRPAGANIETHIGMAVQVGVDPPREEVLAAPQVQQFAPKVQVSGSPTAEVVARRIPDLTYKTSK